MGCRSLTERPESIHYATFCDSLPSMDGLAVAITGSTSGIGLVAAKTVLSKGARVIMLNRPSERAEKAVKDVNALAQQAGLVQHVDCDLQSFDSVRAAAKEVQAVLGGAGLDVLANNAGPRLACVFHLTKCVLAGSTHNSLPRSG